MMRSPLLLLTLLFLLTISGTQVVQAQTAEDALRFSQRENGITARTLGMAGVGAGGIDDWGATVANPASLALVGGTHITGSLDFSTIQSAPSGNSQINSSRVSRFAPGHGAYVHAYPVQQGSLVLGVGAHRLTSLDRSIIVLGPGGSSPTTSIHESGYISEIGITAAVEMVPDVFGGFSFNVLGGAYAATIDNMFSGNEIIEATLRGFNMRAGILAEITPGLRIGLSGETPTWLHTEEIYTASGQGPSPFNYSIQTPWRATTGLVYEVDNYLVAIDLAFIDYPSTRLRPTSTPGFEDENVFITESFRESLDLRIGTEIGFNVGTFRLGYAFAQDPLRDDLDTNRIRHTFASGISYYMMPGITLDLGVSYTQFQDQIYPPIGDNNMPTLRLPHVENVNYLRILAGIQYNL